MSEKWETRPVGERGFEHLHVVRDSEDGEVVATAPKQAAEAISALPELREVSLALLKNLQEGKLGTTDRALIDRFEQAIARTSLPRPNSTRT